MYWWVLKITIQALQFDVYKIAMICIKDSVAKVYIKIYHNKNAWLYLQLIKWNWKHYVCIT